MERLALVTYKERVSLVVRSSENNSSRGTSYEYSDFIDSPKTKHVAS